MSFTRSRRNRVGLAASLVAILVALVATSMPAVALLRMPYPSITLKANTYMQIDWAAVSGATSYALQYSTSSNFSGAVTRLPESSPTEVQINGLTPNTKYYFRIRPRTGNSNMSTYDWSATSSGYTTNTAFPPPSRPSISRARSDGFKISWGEVPNASRYRVQLSTSSTYAAGNPSIDPGLPGGPPIFLYSQNTTNSMYVGNEANEGNATDYNGNPISEDLIKPNTTYYMRVRALEAKVDPSTGLVFNLTDYSSTTSFKTHPSWTAFPVNDLKVVGSSVAGITLQFEDLSAQQFDNDDADSYRIQYWSGSSAKRYVNTDDMDPTTGTVNGVGSGGNVTLNLSKFCNSAAGADSCSAFTSGSTYNFRVAAYKNGVVISDYTDAAGVSAVASSYALTTPGDVRVESAYDNAIKLSWLPVPGATTYRLQQKLTSTSGTTRYLYDICQGPASNSPTASFPCTTSDGRVQVTLPAFADNNAGSTSGLGLGKTYYFRVSAQAGASTTPGIEERKSDYTASYVKAVTPGWPLAPPANIARVAATGTTVTLKWDPSLKFDGSPAGFSMKYRLQIATESDMTGTMTYPVTDTINPGSGPVEFKVTGLKGETTYYFRVRAVNTANTVTYSDYVARALTARTTSAVGSIVSTLNTESGCATDDYRLTAYYGDEVVKAVGPQTAGGSLFRMDGIREGGYRLQYSYVGSANCVSPWVSDDSNINAQSHVLRAYAPGYTVTGASTRTIAQAQTARVGVNVGGTLRNSSNAAVSLADVTALGAPADGSVDNPLRAYREVHDMSITASNGGFALTGLWPGQKYNVYFRIRPTSIGSTGVTDSFWCNAVTVGNPGQSLNLTMGDVTAGKNCVG